MFVSRSQHSSASVDPKDLDCKPLDQATLGSRRAFDFGKRCFDVLLATAMLALVLPFLVFIAVLIKLESRGSVLFVNRAIGQYGKEFWLYKFRSMRPAKTSEIEVADVARNMLYSTPTTYVNGKPVYKTAFADYARITRVGHFLRRTSLDELPQLWNIMRGDLSFVGPRPSLPGEVALYQEWQKRRLLVPQGLTGLYQVTARNRVPIDEMIRMDLDYIRRRSFWLDLKILCKTPFSMFSGL